jgi:hypothetical protein
MPTLQEPRRSAPFRKPPKFRKWLDNPIYQGMSCPRILSPENKLVLRG